jgi:lipopolysaccharide export system permease protein
LNLYLMFPNIALLGTLLGLGALSSSSELTVMRASGMSILQISRAVFYAAFLMIGLAAFVGEYLAPHWAATGEKNKAYFKKNGQVISTEQGIWLRQNQFFIHINQSYDRRILKDITRYELDENFKLARIAHADSASLQGSVWHMNNIVITSVNAEKIVVSKAPTALWDMSVDLSDMDISPRTLSFNKLYEQANLRIDNGIDAGSFWLSFWTRLFQPLTTLMMVFLAVPFAFGPLRSANTGLRLLSGVMIGLAFYIFNRFFGPFILAYQVPPIVGAVLPFLIFSFLLLFLSLRKQ